METVSLDEAQELADLRRSDSFKLFKRLIVEPVMQQLAIDLEGLKPRNVEEGPVLAAQLRVLRKVFDNFNEAIGG